MYVDTRGTTALLSTVVINDSHHEFFIQVITNKNKTTINTHKTIYLLGEPNDVKHDVCLKQIGNKKHFFYCA